MKGVSEPLLFETRLRVSMSSVRRKRGSLRRWSLFGVALELWGETPTGSGGGHQVGAGGGRDLVELAWDRAAQEDAQRAEKGGNAGPEFRAGRGDVHALKMGAWGKGADKFLGKLIQSSSRFCRRQRPGSSRGLCFAWLSESRIFALANSGMTRGGVSEWG